MTDDRKENPPRRKLGDREVAALLAAAAVIGFFVVYWAVQIQSARELLKLAYG